MNDVEFDKSILKQFSESLRDWKEWQETAHSLRRAALVIRQEAQRDWDDRKRHRLNIAQGQFDFPPDLEGTMTFLNGLAIENLVKALWVQKNDPINDKGVLDRKIGHKQKVLLKDVNFKLSNEEEDLLLRLETFVMWAGRYPMPRTSEELGPQPLSGGIKLPLFFTNFN
jgi:hypothetical protein